MQWTSELVERVSAATAHQLFPRLRSKSLLRIVRTLLLKKEVAKHDEAFVLAHALDCSQRAVLLGCLLLEYYRLSLS